jgi:carboxypeptidase C (cathepsin A)
MINFYNLLLLNLYIILISSQERHKVEDLFNELYTKDIYSGYLETDVERNELFYVFTPSQTLPEKDPLFLFLNRGPVCSSLFGLLGEIGPVISVPFENKFILNEYSWIKKANVLFIESPAGVGFSKIIDYNFF